MIDSNQFQAKLQEEKALLEKELGEIAKQDPNNPAHWDAKTGDLGEPEFRDEVADRFEEIDERESTAFALEEQLEAVKRALSKIESGTYGFCEVCKQPIEEERLEAMPSARTCKAHMEEELLDL
jgi:RNA polymerase-binding transcription factor DksA